MSTCSLQQYPGCERCHEPTEREENWSCSEASSNPVITEMLRGIIQEMEPSSKHANIGETVYIAVAVCQVVAHVPIKGEAR